MTGETPGAYIRKRRLAEAARLLKRATGLTPGQYRRARQTLGQSDTLGGIDMDPRFVERGKMLVVGEEGAYGVCFNAVRVFTHRGPLSEIGSPTSRSTALGYRRPTTSWPVPYDFEAWVPVKP